MRGKEPHAKNARVRATCISTVIGSPLWLGRMRSSRIRSTIQEVFLADAKVDSELLVVELDDWVAPVPDKVRFTQIERCLIFLPTFLSFLSVKPVKAIIKIVHLVPEQIPLGRLLL
jgi:hypothetical protein